MALKLCWCVVVFGGVSFKFLRWHIDQALAWPGFAAGLAEIGRACLGFAWGLGQAVQRVAHDMHGLAGPSCMGTSFDDVGAALSSFELEWQCIGIAGVCVCVCRCRGVCVCTIPMQAHGQLHGHIDRCVGGEGWHGCHEVWACDGTAWLATGNTLQVQRDCLEYAMCGSGT